MMLTARSPYGSWKNANAYVYAATTPLRLAAMTSTNASAIWFAIT